jgi:hypothetical protein
MDSPHRFTPSQHASIDLRRLDQHRTRAAIHDLEAALSMAAPLRLEPWRTEVVHALEVLEEATGIELDDADQPESLLSDIRRTQPRLRTRVRGLRSQYVALREAASALRRELVDDPDDVDYADIRQRLGWLLTSMQHQRARESDLIYEAYREAFDAELDSTLDP